jgi:hypothetical protein
MAGDRRVDRGHGHRVSAPRSRDTPLLGFLNTIEGHTVDWMPEPSLACPSCGVQDIQILVQVPGYRLSRCRQCGTEFESDPSANDSPDACPTSSGLSPGTDAVKWTRVVWFFERGQDTIRLHAAYDEDSDGVVVTVTWAPGRQQQTRFPDIAAFREWLHAFETALIEDAWTREGRRSD